MEKTDRLLDACLPRYDFSESHERRVGAAPADVDSAISVISPSDMPLARALMALRSLPTRLTRRAFIAHPPDQPFIDQFVDAGFAVLGHRRGRELAIGGIAQPWRLRGETVRFRDADEFVRFDAPGFVKIATDFRTLERDGGTLLVTDTRVLATDPSSRRRFARYWWLIRAGSGAIRRSILRAAARRAVASSGSSR